MGDCSQRNAYHEHVSSHIRLRPVGQSQSAAFRGAGQAWRDGGRAVRRGFSSRVKRNNMFRRAQKAAAIRETGVGVGEFGGTAFWGRKCEKYPLRTDEVRCFMSKTGAVLSASDRWSAVG